jgi:predicted cupin superfamily sugar epimerase
MDELIKILDLQPLADEGGLWAPVYREDLSNAIYYMMVAPDFSAWHRIKEAELWIHIAGKPVELFSIEDNKLKATKLDRDLGHFSYRVPANTWMAARPSGDWSLVICALTPAFSGMELAVRSNLISEFAHLEIPELFHE